MKDYPSLTIYHPSSRGVGSALRLKLIPFVYDDPHRSGKLEIKIAKQDGDEYDWSCALYENLDFEDVTRMLMVFRGEAESINDGAGITHWWTHTFNMSHVIEPVHGYRMMLTSGDRLAAFMLKPAEALGISLALEQSMSKLVFEMEG